MEYRQLGHSGLRVSSLTLGTMTFGGRGGFSAVGATDVQGARRQLDRCLDAGVNLVDTGEATRIDATGPAYDAARAAFTEAWDGTEPVDMGVGGSIPFIAEFLDAFPEASVLVTGVEDPDTRAHGANEGLHLGEFEKVVLAETLLLRNLGRGSASQRHSPLG